MKEPCPLGEGHDTSGFDCGVEALNLYLKRYARQTQKREGARTYVVLTDSKVVAYYTIVFGGIDWKDLLLDALKKALAASEIAGLRAVVVDAKNDTAKGFYEKRGFRPWPVGSNRLFVTIRELKNEAESYIESRHNLSL